jgi:four helix bundle protein
MSSSYRDLRVWQASLDLVVDIYRLCELLPKSEQFGLTSQIQRSAVSIPSNIAEGQQRNGNKEFRQFLGIARGSAAELSTQLLLAQRIYKVDVSAVISRLEDVQKMLYALQVRL